MNKLIFFILISLFVFIGLSQQSFAQDGAVFEVGIPWTDVSSGKSIEAGQELGTTSVTDYIRFIYLFLLGIVGIAGFASLVWYGIIWIYSGIAEKKGEAMEGIKNTMIGIGLALSAWLILYTVNPDLVALNPPIIEESADLTTDIKEYESNLLDDRDTRGSGYYFTFWVDGSPEVRFKGPHTTLIECNNTRIESKNLPKYHVSERCTPYGAKENIIEQWSYRFGRENGLLTYLMEGDEAECNLRRSENKLEIVRPCTQLESGQWFYKAGNLIERAENSEEACNTSRTNFITSAGDAITTECEKKTVNIF